MILSEGVVITLFRSKYTKRIMPEVLKNPWLAYMYALTTRRPFPEGEEAIAKDGYCALWYAISVLHGPFPEGEEAIATDPHMSLNYARNVLDDRFPAGEAAIARNPFCSEKYNEFVSGYDSGLPRYGK